MTTRTLTGTIRRSDGAPWAHATLRIQKLALGAQPGEVYPVDGFNVTADANGVLPATPLAVPEAGTWLRRMTFPDTTEIDFYLGAGGPIAIDEIVALAGAAGQEAATPQGEFLNRLHAIVAAAAEERLLATAGGDLALTDAPRGYWMQRTAVPADVSVTVPAGCQMVVFGALDVAGELIAAGDVVVL